MESYKFYTDKPILFECKIELEGASLDDTVARLVLETDSHSILFEGAVHSGGRCEIPVKKMKGILPEETTGRLRLEVIAEDTFFQPWESDFIVEQDKKMVVEVKEPKTSRPKVTAEVKGQTSLQKAEHGLVTELKKKKITVKTLVENKKLVNQLINEQADKHRLTEAERSSMINRVVKLLAN